MEVKFIKCENNKIPDDAYVKVIDYCKGREKEIRYSSNTRYNSALNSIKTKSKTEYWDDRTKTIKQRKVNDKKTTEGLRRSLKRVEELAKNNFFGEKNEAFISFTTAKSTTDVNEIKTFFKRFIRRLRKVHPNIEYLCVLELQEDRGSWHLHGLFKDPSKKVLKLREDVIYEMWGVGSVKVKEIYDIKELINYICKKESKEKIPVNINVYFKSKGIKKPTVTKDLFKNVMQKISNSYKLIKENSFEIIHTGYYFPINTIKSKFFKRRE